MPEGFDVVDCYNRNVKLIFQEEISTVFDIDLLKGERIITSCGTNGILCVVT
jgi:hypothetical protein